MSKDDNKEAAEVLRELDRTIVYEMECSCPFDV